jgi:hypothetical protein
VIDTIRRLTPDELGLYLCAGGQGHNCRKPATHEVTFGRVSRRQLIPGKGYRCTPHAAYFAKSYGLELPR